MKKLILTLAAVMSLTVSANAALMNITMEGPLVGDKVDFIVKNDNPAGNSNNVATHATWLDDYVIPWYNGVFDPDLPSRAGLDLIEFHPSANGVGPTIDLTGILFLTYHFGGGQGGGILVALYNNGMTGDYTVPANLYGSGGISTVYGWGTRTPVPDSGTTLALLGAALLGVIGFRRFKK
ncbi:VPDSG-CTERM sorting domain-containing protein [Pelagicoccus enzymogenes]|uniref:VPDSG-CTERM sorting domain-containing protein n=1 Tax=Pelagicoccus enzymogenes TaxID=2773457 RepID=UPI00280DE834|nr:VPDSG-CTERM sorting domain-containing protein [Pelagicoccus enzymogenes]MDQ8197937.1 VPDSG-CTERM sorting domain-containing protein [Pelagicoccus enzymogenes]